MNSTNLHPVPPLPFRLPLEPEDAPAHEEPVDDLDGRQQGEPHAEPQEAADVGDEVSHAVKDVALVLSVGVVHQNFTFKSISCVRFNLGDLDDVLVLEEDVEQRGVLLQPLEVDVSRILHPLQLGTLWISSMLSSLKHTQMLMKFAI